MFMGVHLSNGWRLGGRLTRLGAVTDKAVDVSVEPEVSGLDLPLGESRKGQSGARS